MYPDLLEEDHVAGRAQSRQALARGRGAGLGLLGGGVALVILLGAGLAGKAGDKFGQLRVVTVALWAYGFGYLVMIFTTSRPVIVAAIPLIALGGGAIMTLAYAILMPLMPEDEHGL